MKSCAILETGKPSMTSSPDVPFDARPPSERRRMPRYSFIIAVEVVEPVSDLRLSGRVSEISSGGCYVDILNTLPMGTVIRLRMSRDQGDFSAVGKIIYVQEGVGMGIEFQNMPPDQVKILNTWLAELRK